MINMKEIAKAINEATANVRLDPSLENVRALRHTCVDASLRCDRMHRDYAHVDCAIRAAKNAMANLGRALFTTASEVDYTPTPESAAQAADAARAEMKASGNWPLVLPAKAPAR